MKLLYLSTWDFANEMSDGVCKKIKAQIEVFEAFGIDVDVIYINGNDIVFSENGVIRKIATVGAIKKTPAYIKLLAYAKEMKYDWVYNRYGMMDPFYYRVLKQLHSNGAKIIVEIPSYPYVGEMQKGLFQSVMVKWDEMYSRKLKPIVNAMLTYSEHKEIFGIPTLQIMNGIKTEDVNQISGSVELDDTIDLLIVAYMQKHHGCERLLEGVYNYYNNGGKRYIRCHFVGDGPEKEYYEELSQKYGLGDKVIFYGTKSGRELDDIYEKSDIGVCAMGAYKKNTFISSELKSREYLAKGLPIISGVTIDLFKDTSDEYYLEFSNDSKSIDIESVIDFYDKIYYEGVKRLDVVTKVRNHASDIIDIKSVMKKVIDKIYETDEET